VRDAAGTPISRTTDTVVLVGTADRWLRLPGPPVISVAQVAIDAVTLAGQDYRLANDALWRWCGWRPVVFGATEDMPAQVTVTYTHGLATVPADVVELVCAMTIAAVTAATALPGGAGLAASAGITSERVDDYSVTYATPTGPTAFDLSDATRARLAARFGGGAQMVRAR